MASSGVWSWTDGKPFAYTDWKNDEPNLDPGMDCVQTEMVDGFWQAVNCFNKMPFICTTAALKADTCPATCDQGWALFNLSCYKLGFNADFDDSEAFCVTNGGHLASIHSTQENIFVAGLARTGMLEDGSKQPWIGLKTSDGSNWFWTDNTKLDFTSWGSKQPEIDNSKNCGQIFVDKSLLPSDSGLYEKWQNYDCSKSARAFVCKKPSI